MASGRVSIAWPFLRSGVRPAYPVLIIYLAFVQSPGNVDGQYGSWHCGVLVCSNDSDGIINGVTVFGNVNGTGGLVGGNDGIIQDSTAKVAVVGGTIAGGLN